MARLLGKPFMPWQQYVADVVLEIDPATGELWYSEYDLTVPRQSGKSTFVLAKAAHRCTATKFFGPRQQLVYTAQTRKDARKKFEEDFFPDIEASPRLKARDHWGNGNEHIRFPNRSRFGIESTTEKAGHGGTLDEAFVDEAFAQIDGRLEQAFGPAMITRRNTQIGVISTAGWLDGSPYLRAKVDHGRQMLTEDRPSRVAYFEWSAPEDADPFDKKLWPTYMPALGFTITETAIEGELDKAQASPEGLNGFRRPYMNLWVPKGVDSPAVPMAAWQSCADAESQIVGQPVLAASMTPDRETVSLVAAGRRPDGLAHLEVVLQGRAGDWFVPKVAEIARRQGAEVAVQPGHPIGALLPDLIAAGVRVRSVKGAEHVQSCGGFYDAVTSGRLRYPAPQPELDAAVGKATPRRSGDAWRWAGDNISALIAASHALWVLTADPNVYEERGLVVL